MKKSRSRISVETPGYFKLGDHLRHLGQNSTSSQRKHIMRLLNASDNYSAFEEKGTTLIVHLRTTRGEESRLHESFGPALKRLSELPGGLASLAKAIEWVPDLERLFVNHKNDANLEDVYTAFIGAETTCKYAKKIYRALSHVWVHQEHHPYEDTDILLEISDLHFDLLARFDAGAFRAINAIAAAHSAFRYKKK